MCIGEQRFRNSVEGELFCLQAVKIIVCHNKASTSLAMLWNKKACLRPKLKLGNRHALCITLFYCCISIFHIRPKLLCAMGFSLWLCETEWSRKSQWDMLSGSYFVPWFGNALVDRFDTIGLQRFCCIHLLRLRHRLKERQAHFGEGIRNIHGDLLL